MNICEQAAIDTAFDRHVDQAFAIVSCSKVDVVVGTGRVLRAITGDADRMTPPGPRHPASRALRGGKPDA